MSHFDSFLRRTDERLALPKATRSLILVEIAADLDDLFQHYVDQGLSEEEAAARAEEKVNMSDEALVELVRIHSEARGWSDRMVRRAQPFWERMAMAVIVLGSLAIAALELDLELVSRATGFIWPVVVLGIALVVNFVIQLVRSPHDLAPRRLRDGLVTPLFLGAASALAGFLGAAIVLYQTLRNMAATPERAGPMFSQAVIGSTTTLVAALAVTVLAGIAWFVLAGRAARVEDAAGRRIMEVS